MKIKKLFGFTLAEVLITLAIIGVVAALTLPTLMSNYKKQEAVTRLKKVIATVEQANKMAIADNPNFYNWTTADDLTPEKVTSVVKTLLSYMNVAEECGHSTGDCFTSTGYYLNGESFEYSNSGKHYYAKLHDGSSIHFALQVHPPKPEGEGNLIAIEYDSNGLKAPNTIGKDIFEFKIVQDGVLTIQEANEYSMEWLLSNLWYNCNPKSKYGGYRCTQVIIKNDWKYPDNIKW